MISREQKNVLWSYISHYLFLYCKTLSISCFKPNYKTHEMYYNSENQKPLVKKSKNPIWNILDKKLSKPAIVL